MIPGATIPRLILADGTVLENSECGYYEHELHCWIKDRTMAEVFELFSDPNKTAFISYTYRDYTQIYRGFTEMFLIRKTEDCIDVRLTGGTRGGSEDDQNETE